jgi:CRP-like cAMP-binding protein
VGTGRDTLLETVPTWSSQLQQSWLTYNLAQTSPLFAPFTELERLALAVRVQFLAVDEGLRGIEEVGRSGGLFVLLAGEAHAFSNGRMIARLLPGDTFGEISLITGQPPTAPGSPRPPR